MDRVYVDCEYAFPCMTRESGRPTEADLREIVQVAAIRVNPETGEELRHLDVLVKPTFVVPTPPFFIELTGITLDEIEALGVSFEAALHQFLDFCKNANVWTYNADWSVFQQNCKLHTLGFPFASQPFSRVCSMLKGWGVDNHDSYSSGTLHRAAGLEMEGQVHNALFDVRSMHAAVFVFEHRQ